MLIRLMLCYDRLVLGLGLGWLIRHLHIPDVVPLPLLLLVALLPSQNWRSLLIARCRYRM